LPVTPQAAGKLQKPFPSGLEFADTQAPAEDTLFLNISRSSDKIIGTKKGGLKIEFFITTNRNTKQVLMPNLYRLNQHQLFYCRAGHRIMCSM